MKKMILLAVLACVVYSCKKNPPQATNSSLIGKWRLSESLADPGDGSGTWQSADPSNPSSLEFKPDGSLVFLPGNMYNSDHYQVINDSVMTFMRGSENFPMRYHFTETLLTINPPCIEACGERYVPDR